MPGLGLLDFSFAPARVWSCIGRPDDAFKSLVDEQGRLLYGFESDAPDVFRFSRTLAWRLTLNGEPGVSQVTESARVPVVVTTLSWAQATLRLQAFARLDGQGRRADVVLWTVTAAHEPGTTPGAPPADPPGVLVSVWLQAQENGLRFITAGQLPGRRVYAIAAGAAPSSPDSVTGSTLHEADAGQPPEAPLAFVSDQPLVPASAFDFGSASGLQTEPFFLRPGESARGAVVIPLDGRFDPTELTLAWAEAALQAEREYWNALPALNLPLRVPDEDVQALLVACARNILQAREVKDGLPEFQVGPTVYRGLWIADGHFFLEAARYLGWLEDAARGIDALLRREKANGAFEQHAHHTKETGIALATLVRQCELGNDRERLAGLWPKVMAGAAHIERMRAESEQAPEGAPERGLMSQSFGDGGLGGRRAEYTTTLWALAGLNHAIRGARWLERPEDEAKLQAQFDGLLAAFRRCAARDLRVTPDGLPYLPMLMPGSGEHHLIPGVENPPRWQQAQPGTATWAFAQAVYPGEVFDASDPLVQNLLDLFTRLAEEEGIPKETGWLPFQGLWTYHASFAAHALLYAGRGEEAARMLYAFANHAAPTRVWREEQGLKRGGRAVIVGDMPHNWASVEFIRLTRHLLLMEAGDGLHFLRGLPRAWANGPVNLQAAATRYGPVNLDLNADGHGVTILISAAPEGWPKPAFRRLHLTEFPALDSVLVNGRQVALGAGFVDLPEGEVTLRLTSGEG